MLKIFPTKLLTSKTINYFGKNSTKCRSISATGVNRDEEQTTQTIEPKVLVEKDANITLIGINRETSRNSIDAATAQLLTDALSGFEADNSSPVAVLYGVGGNFSAGHDVIELEQQAEQGNFDFLLKHEGSVGPTRRHLRKPVVCGINGYCVGAGLELALMCDLRVMEDTALLGFFNRRFGVPITNGGTVRLAAAIGYSRALDLIATGRSVGAKEALEFGLINRLVATGTALGQAVHLAFTVAKFPMASLQHDRTAIYANTYGQKSFHQAMQNEVMTMSNEVIREIQEGARRFKNSTAKGPRSSSWHVNEKPIADWEKEEIAHEERYAREQLEKKSKKPLEE